MGEDSDLKSAHEAFHKAVQRGRDTVQNATLNTVERIRLDTATAIVRLEKGVDVAAEDVKKIARLSIEEREQILSWLSNLDQIEHQRDTFAKHHAGTGSWLFNKSSFQEWVHGASASTFWCPGDPGVGKSVMMYGAFPFPNLRSAAVCYVEDITTVADRGLAYFYCDYNDQETQSASKIWANIVRQLATQCVPLPTKVKTFCDQFLEKRSHPSIDNYISLLIYLSGLFQKTFVLVDALDECPEQERERFIETATKVQDHVRLFLTSRPNIDLDGRFFRMTRVDIVAHEDDLRAYLEHRLATDARPRRLLSQDPRLKDEIIEKLLQQAVGMFLLVQLQIDSLSTKLRPLDVRNSLKELATDIHHFYDNCVQRIERSEDKNKDFALQVLTFVFRAQRPLSMDELAHALSVDPGTTDLFSDALYDKDLIFSASYGLIQVDEAGKGVRLVHHTLHEYLQKFGARLLGDRERDLAVACLTYLSFEPFANGPCLDAASMTGRLNKYCFLDYACHHWYSHARGYMDDEMLQAALAFLKDKEKLATCVQVLRLPQHRVGDWHTKYPRNFTLLHAVAYWNMSRMLEEMGQDGCINIDCKDSYGMTPLLWCAAHGHSETMKCFRDLAASLDCQNNQGETALMLGARHRHEAVVEFCLRQGADHTIEDEEGWTALHWAIIGGQTDILKSLLHAVTRNQTDKTQHNKALILAAEAGNSTIVQMLLDEGATVDCVNDAGSTPLHWAVPEGHLETSKILLEHGANPSSTDMYNNAPIHWTVPHPSIAQLLASYGADVGATNRHGQSALLWSVLAGRIDTVEALISLGANVQISNQFGFTPLHAAALRGDGDILSFLLSKGANPNEIDKDGWTPLHAAALVQNRAIIDRLLELTENGREIALQVARRLTNDDMRSLMQEMAERKSHGSIVVSGLRCAISNSHTRRLMAMLDNGADIDSEDELGGSTALTSAAALGQDGTVRLLLDHGASIDLRERSGRTALHWAALMGHLDVVVPLIKRGAMIDLRVFGWTAMLLAARSQRRFVVNFLVANGASVTAQDFHGRTALHWSCIHGDQAVAQKLIHLGADVDARDHSGQTALHWAVASRHLSVANTLLRRGAAVDMVASDGTMPLHLAAYNGQRAAVTMLLTAEQKRAKGPNRSSSDAAGEDEDGLTALEVAELTGNWQTAQLLKGLDGADKSKRSNRGRPQPKVPPPLALYKDEEQDYLVEDGLPKRLGRMIMGPKVRQWLIDRREQTLQRAQKV